MKNIKKIIAVCLSLLTIFTSAFFVGAAKKNKPAGVEKAVEKVEEGNASADKKLFNKERALTAALTAAKARFAVEKIDTDTISVATVTKLKYNKKDSSFSVTVRAKRIHKYECRLSVKNFLGTEVGIPEDSTYKKQGKIPSFFGQGFEKISYFFIRLFNMDEVKK